MVVAAAVVDMATDRFNGGPAAITAAIQFSLVSLGIEFVELGFEFCGVVDERRHGRIQVLDEAVDDLCDVRSLDGHC